MNVRKQSCFDTFRCIAGACPDSCCKDWEIVVDEESAARYQAISGPLGRALQNGLMQEDGDWIFRNVSGRCPMWRQDGLCRLQAELGESALCNTCREYPRLTHDYGDFREYGLELSCPEAARLLLTTPWHPVEETTPGDGAGEYDEEVMELLKSTRQQALELVGAYPPAKAMALLLLYGACVQEAVDGGEVPEFDPDAALETAKQMGTPGDRAALLAFYRELEILTDRWRERLSGAVSQGIPPENRYLLEYFIERYWIQAVSDYDLYSRVKWMVVSCLVISALGGDFVQTAQLYSKEIENSADNMDALLDAMQQNAEFNDRSLLGMALSGCSREEK